jgi:hypothetical protein
MTVDSPGRRPRGRARRGLRLGPMVAGMSLVVGVLTAGALTSAAPSHDDTLDCGEGAVQVIQADGTLLPGPAGNLASPAEAKAGAAAAVHDFVSRILPGLPVDAVVEVPASAAGTTLPPLGGDGAELEVPAATLATRDHGVLNAVITLERDASGRRWAVDRVTLCATTAVGATPGGPAAAGHGPGQ